MSSLHTLHHANPDALNRALAAALTDDALLLREDAVLLGRHPILTQLPCAVCYALQADIDARGLQSLLPGFIQPISDSAFVTLTLQYDRVIAWR